MRCIAGDVAPSSGRIELDGEPLAANPAAAGRRGVAVVWQDLALCENLDIAANLMLGHEPPGLLRSATRFQIAAATKRLAADLGIPPGRHLRARSASLSGRPAPARRPSRGR